MMQYLRQWQIVRAFNFIKLLFLIVQALHCFLKVLVRWVGVDLGTRQIGMAQQGLNRSHVGHSHESGGVGMTEHVRMELAPEELLSDCGKHLLDGSAGWVLPWQPVAVGGVVAGDIKRRPYMIVAIRYALADSGSGRYESFAASFGLGVLEDDGCDWRVPQPELADSEGQHFGQSESTIKHQEDH